MDRRALMISVIVGLAVFVVLFVLVGLPLTPPQTTPNVVVLGSKYNYRKIDDFTEVWLEVQNQGDVSCYVWVTFKGLYDEKVTAKVMLNPDDIYRFEAVLNKKKDYSDEVTYELHYET